MMEADSMDNGSSATSSGENPPVPVPPPREDLEANTIKRCTDVLQRLHLEQGEPLIHGKENVERGTIMLGDCETTVTSNVFGLKTADIAIFQYHVALSKVLTHGSRAGQTFPLFQEDVTRKPSDHTAYQNRQMGRKLLDAFVAKFPANFGNGLDYLCYDYAATLFSITELSAVDTPMELTDQEALAVIERPFKVVLVLKKPANHVFNVRDWKKNVRNDLSDEASNNIIRFLELATSHYASQHPEDHVMYESKKTYFMNPEKFGFDSPELNGGKYLSAGASKIVVRIEGPANKGSTAVVVDSKKTPFYKSVNLLEMICTALQSNPQAGFPVHQRDVVNKYVKRLECFPIYGNRQNIPIILSVLAEVCATNAMIEHAGARISIAQYYHDRYGITLSFPQWPLVIGAKKIQGNIKPMFPLELLFVADYQRVGNGNISPTDIAAIVKACAVAPSVKTDEIARCHQSFAFGDDALLKNAHLEVLAKPLDVQARIIKGPKVVYANGSLNPEGNGKWRLPHPAQYIRCVQIGRWCALFLNVRGERTTLSEFQQFVEKFYYECLHRGLQIQTPTQIWAVDCESGAIEEAFHSAASTGCQYILIGHSDRDTKMHSVIKGMERKYQLISQCVKTRTIFNVLKKSPLTLENIVAKANVKLGGLNYDIVLENYHIDPTILFIGLGMNHPGGGMGAPPQHVNDANPNGSGSNSSQDSFNPVNVSILGFAANDGLNPNEFIGNFYFQPMNCDENIGVLDKLLEEVLQRFQKNRKSAPSRIIFYRNGCTEGQYAHVLRYEIPVIASVIKKYAPQAPFTLIVPSKVHSFRFFMNTIDPRARSDHQNIRPGTVIDGAVVSNALCEFYLNSHLAIQGSAKTPKYTIIYHSEKVVKLDMFERLTNALCYNFQIVTSPTSLPAPVYIANRYAERGRQIYNTFASSGDANLSNGNNSNGNGNGGNNHNGVNGNAAAGAENKYYAKSVAYNFTNQENLRDKRINA